MKMVAISTGKTAIIGKRILEYGIIKRFSDNCVRTGLWATMISSNHALLGI